MATAASPSTEVEHRIFGSDLTVRFRGQPPDEEVVHYLRRSASRLVHAAAPIEVIVEPHRYGTQVTIRGPDSPYPVVEVEPDVFVAIRNAFARWDAGASIQLAASQLARP